jgi:hypothetical protein
MDRKNNEILKDKDILGMDKPTNQLRPLKRKNDTWFLVLTLVILMIVATVAFYLRNK